MFADPRCSPRDAPWRAVVDRRFAGIGEAATEFRMLDLFPETAIVQMRVVEQLLWRADRTPGETALLRPMIDVLGRQAGDKARDQTVDDVRGVGGDHRLVLVFRVTEIAGHAVRIEHIGQFPDVFGIEPAADQGANVIAVTGSELGTRGRPGGMVTAGVSLQHLTAVDVIGDGRLRRQRARLMDRCVYTVSAT